jgi:hypothetical protein
MATIEARLHGSTCYWRPAPKEWKETKSILQELHTGFFEQHETLNNEAKAPPALNHASD